MEKTWRWFGKKDKITLDMLRQIGVEGIVTACRKSEDCFQRLIRRTPRKPHSAPPVYKLP